MSKGFAVAIVLLFSFLPYVPVHLDFNRTAEIPTGLVERSSSAEGLQLFYTSRWNSTPTPLAEGDLAIGDHVVLHAFVDEPDVYQTNLSLASGFLDYHTAPLIIPSNPGAALGGGIINASEFAWHSVSGLKRGDVVRIVGDFTNTDSDFIAWPSDIPMDERTIANNILGALMLTDAHPEVAMIDWTSLCDTVDIACLCYDEQSGTYELNVDTRVSIVIPSSGNSVSFDTYSFLGANQTFTWVEVNAKNSTGFEYSYRIGLGVCNYFAPDCEVAVDEAEYPVYNITWSCLDLNQDDTNYFDVLLSSDGGITYYQLASNLTEKHYVWDSAGFLEHEYLVKIRAYSADFTVTKEIAPGIFWPDVEISRQTYWPGDFDDALSNPFMAGDVGHGLILGDVILGSPSDITIFKGITGNLLLWTIDFTLSQIPIGLYPLLSYSISVDGEHVLNSLHDCGASLTIGYCLDDLTVGTHMIRVQVENPGPSGGYVTDSVEVTVRPAHSAILISNAILVFDIVAGVVIVVSTASIIRSRMHQGVSGGVYE